MEETSIWERKAKLDNKEKETLIQLSLLRQERLLLDEKLKGQHCISSYENRKKGENDECYHKETLERVIKATKIYVDDQKAHLSRLETEYSEDKSSEQYKSITGFYRGRLGKGLQYLQTKEAELRQLNEGLNNNVCVNNNVNVTKETLKKSSKREQVFVNNNLSEIQEPQMKKCKVQTNNVSAKERKTLQQEVESENVSKNLLQPKKQLMMPPTLISQGKLSHPVTIKTTQHNQNLQPIVKLSKTSSKQSQETDETLKPVKLVESKMQPAEKARFVEKEVKEEDLETFSCKYKGCLRSFVGAAPMVSHMVTHFPPGHLIQCPFSNCFKKYSQKEAMAAHVRSKHTKETTYPCQTCEGSFATYPALTMHERNHKDPTKDHCNSCLHFFMRGGQHICQNRP